MSKKINAKVGNPQNSTSKKCANLNQPWYLAFFQDYIFNNKKIHSQWKIAHNWQSKEHKNNKKTPKNESYIGLQSWPDVLQHPVHIRALLSHLGPQIFLWHQNIFQSSIIFSHRLVLLHRKVLKINIFFENIILEKC